MVGSRGEVVADAPVDHVHLPVGDDRVHQPAARAAGEVLVAEAEPLEARLLMRCREVPGDMGRGDLAGAAGVGIEHHRLFHREEGIRPHDPACPRGVLDGDEVGERAPGACGRQLEHLRAEGGQETGRSRFGRGTVDRYPVHGPQIGVHRGDRPAPGGHGVAVHFVDRVVDAVSAQAQYVPSGERLAQRARRGGGGDRVPERDVGDAGADGDAPGRRQQQPRLAHRVAAERLPEPDRPVAQLLQLRGRFPYPPGRLAVVGEGPYPDTAQLEPSALRHPCSSDSVVHTGEVLRFLHATVRRDTPFVFHRS